MSPGRYVGQALPHESAEAHVRGEARYTDDLYPRLRGVLHAWPVTAPCAHGRLRGMQLEAARAMPGVVAVLTGEVVPGDGNVGVARRDEPLFPEEIVFHGQPVAWVLAETEPQARAAAAAVRLDVEQLPALTTLREALEAAQFLTDELRIVRLQEGVADIEAALAACPRRLDGELEIGGQEHFYLEGQAALAYVDEDGRTMVHASTQHPTETQAMVARVLGVPSHQVTCQSLRMGGAFGGKEVQANAWACVAALGAWRTGRPVRVRLDRAHDFAITGKRHPFLVRYEAGFEADGRLRALKMRLYADGGHSLDLSRPILQRALFHVDNAYELPNVDVAGRVCRTHKPSNTAFRGFGGPQAMVAIEEVMDRIARATGRPPHQVRARNFYGPGSTTHYGQRFEEAERLGEIWTRVLERSDFEARRAAIERFNRSGRHRKRGLAITPVKFGISFTTAHFNQAGALVLVYADGSVQVNHGGTEMGQGLHTKIRQVAADALGVPIERVRPMPTRTDKVPNTSATAASSGSDLNGQAVRAACLKLRERLATVAATRFGCAPQDVVFEDGRVHPLEAPERAVPFAEVTRQAYLQRVPLMATGFYRTPGLHYDERRGRGHPFHYFALGAAVTEVEVDGFTGQYRVLRVDIVHDVGRSLSPLVDRGQIEGGYVQGLGWLTREQLVWEPASGRLRTGGPSTYKIPSAGDCPIDFRVELLPRPPQPGVVHGSKAVGEPPLMLAISAREALREAVAAFAQAPPERVDLDVPATPEAVYWAIERLRTS